MIAEVLAKGRAHTTTGRELARLFGCGIREISLQIERERRAGAPICAAVGANPGYFIAANKQELKAYCGQLFRRAGEMHRTRKALLEILPEMEGGEDDENEGSQ